MRWRLAPILLAGLAFVLPGKPTAPTRDPGRLPIDELETRAALLTRGVERIESYYRLDVEPVAETLARSSADPQFKRRVAVALVIEGRSAGIDPRVLASILLVENPDLDPKARSSMSAVGLMQVMPMHANRWGCASGDLTDVRANICHGARIFASYLRRHDGDLDDALLAYNGCVKGTVTPNCFQYPNWVYTRAGRAAMNYWLDIP